MASDLRLGFVTYQRCDFLKFINKLAVDCLFIKWKSVCKNISNEGATEKPQMVSGVQESQWAVPPSAHLKFHALTKCAPMAQLGLPVSLLQERSRGHESCDPGYGRSCCSNRHPQDLCHLPHGTISSPLTRFQINIYLVCVRPCVHSVLLPSHSGSPHISPGVIYFTFSLSKFQDQS